MVLKAEPCDQLDIASKSFKFLQMAKSSFSIVDEDNVKDLAEHDGMARIQGNDRRKGQEIAVEAFLVRRNRAHYQRFGEN